VLDAACGTGRHAAYLTRGDPEVIGIDASEAMLARTRRRPRPDVGRRLRGLGALE